MSAEPRRVTKPEVWAEWEGRVVNRVFPLHRFLGGSSQGAVFATEYKAGTLPDVAIKFVATDSIQPAAQLVQWGTVATLSHPHLLRIFDVGRCQLGGREFLYVLMEYAEQTLAQILPKRALSPDEVREMLLPTLDTLGFLHRNQLVHGQLKPANILVVNDQLKLSSDNVRPIGNVANGVARGSLYDPPELREGVISPAGDVWGLGMTLVEALTQHAPTWATERSEAAPLPVIPGPFAQTLRRCLSQVPANRPTVSQLEGRFKPAHPIEVSVFPEVTAIETPREVAPAQDVSKRRVSLPVIAIALLAAVVIAVGVRSWRDRGGSHEATADESQTYAQPAEHGATVAEPSESAGPAVVGQGSEPASAGAESPAPKSAVVAPIAAVAPTHVAVTPTTDATPAPVIVAPAAPARAVAASTGVAAPTRAVVTPAPADVAAPTPTVAPPARAVTTREPAMPKSAEAAASPSVLHEVSPDVPPAISNRIRGHVNVTVRVLVDPAGNVVGEFLESPGPSRYFARLASNAAGEWKFAPTEERGSRVWLLHFEFIRGGVTAKAAVAR